MKAATKIVRRTAQPISKVGAVRRRHSLAKITARNWQGSALRQETTLHQLSPYIGKLKSSIAKSLVLNFSCKGECVYDPFSGSGTVALEAWIAGRNVIANDLSDYARLLTSAKLFPPVCVEDALAEIASSAKCVSKIIADIDLRKTPSWVRSFFHPETLREIMAWSQVFKERKQSFLLACLLGILHHQRPGFLSFPSSHSVPYLRKKKFPRNRFPKLYEYRELRARLEKKIIRAFRRIPNLDTNLKRTCRGCDAKKANPPFKAHSIITSPPYMRQLDYGRDNRLRLWFLGVGDWKALDEVISPSEEDFLNLMKACFISWKKLLVPGGYCVLVLGDTYSKKYKINLPELVKKIATNDIAGYAEVMRYSEAIPNERRVRRGCDGSKTETILVLRSI